MNKGGLKFEIFKHDSFLLEHHGMLHRIKQLWTKLRSKKKQTSFYTAKRSKKSIKKRSVSFNLLGLSRKKSFSATIDATRGAYLWMRVK
jgi:hypothetical protein